MWTVCAQSKLRCQQGTEQRPGHLQSRAQRVSVHLAQLNWSPMERSSGLQTNLETQQRSHCTAVRTTYLESRSAIHREAMHALFSEFAQLRD